MDADRLQITRNRLRSEHTKLRRARGRALADGKAFDGKRLAAIESELAALDDVEAELATRAYVADVEDTRAYLKSSIAALGSRKAARVAAAGEMQQHFRSAAEALAKYVRVCEEERRAAIQLHHFHDGGVVGNGGPFDVTLLTPANVDLRLARYLRPLLGRATGRRQIGNIDLSPQPNDVGGSWAAVEDSIEDLTAYFERVFADRLK